MSSPLIAALLAPDAKKKSRKDPSAKREKTGEKSPSATGQQHGELQSYREPTPAQRVKMHAREAKVHATRRWIEGELSNKQHEGIHARANRVLTNQVSKRTLPKGW